MSTRMSQQSDISLIRECYDAFKRGDIDTVLANLDANVDWRVYGPEESPMTGIWRGVDQVRSFFQAISNNEEMQEFEPKQYLSEGNTVVVLGHYRSVAKATRRVMDSDWVHVFTMKNGKVESFREYFDPLAAAEAFQGPS